MRVILVGRPNAGKSSVFNRLVGPNKSVVSSEPGTTRDWREQKSKYGDWTVIDTPGIEGFTRPLWWDAVGSCKWVWIMDTSEPVLDLDHKVADWLRDKDVMLCRNKQDIIGESSLKDWGFKSHSISVRTGHGWGEFVSMLDDGFAYELTDTPPTHKYMIIGQPNAGKSSLVNALYGGDRVVVSSEAGTTVDVVDVECDIGLVSDTPGLKRRKYGGYMSDAVENAVRRIRAFRGVVLFVIDGSEPLVVQDLKLANLAWDTGNPVFILLNKWDLVGGDICKEWLQEVHRVAPMEVMEVSARSGLNLDLIKTRSDELLDEWSKRISTAQVNKWSSQMIVPKNPKIKYVAQVGTRPPKLFVSGKKLSDRDLRFVARQFREGFGFHSIPIKIEGKMY